MLAAANSVFGRWDDTKGEENIDFMPTILSRFDMIFVVKDEHDELRDTVLLPDSPHSFSPSCICFMCSFRSDAGKARHEHSHERAANLNGSARRRTRSAHAQEVHRLLPQVDVIFREEKILIEKDFK